MQDSLIRMVRERHWGPHILGRGGWNIVGYADLVWVVEVLPYPPYAFNKDTDEQDGEILG